MPASETHLRLEDLKLGSLHVGFPVVQAALSGYSDGPMRTVARRHGASYAICEVLLDQFLVSVKRGRAIRALLQLSDEDHPVGGQLMGAEPDQFGAAAMRLVEAGFDAIDINFGCPVRKVLGRCRGGFHLGQPAVALRIIQRTREAVPAEIPVTVKMRCGIDRSQQSVDHFYTILDGAFDSGVAAVTVHSRTVQQRYIGCSDWGFLGQVKQHVGSRTVLGSGDLMTAHDCLEMIRVTGVDGVTVARGAIGNPWIFSQARALAAGQPLPAPPTLRQQAEVLVEHFRLAEDIYGPRCGPKMRKFGIKYSALHPRHREVRDAMVKVRCRHDWEAVIATWYADDGPGQYPDPRIHYAQVN
jgi:nifR3 family TIM-barrel protein